ncbi:MULTISPECIES: mechanosensitive ion channel family protein [unclassified Caballeronia]|uniref:mechanosensitive ion channel family protein n=1 Tax=unclassified Caballeronia TaxID=2646786 RepID=UPI0028657BB2|nr:MULTISPECIES: mechanosensitive ion channel family protein [unclassified Caballeronia]MDR5774263.1 mechanosensitive ion channel family protein [Caballeronia sp. LZ002]MDR5849698.1 mechanosensitive ion channel family protein [Caballeronia sp. LZ003]
MPTLTDGLLFGIAILVVDFLAWRFMDRRSEPMRLAFRASMFALSTWVLFAHGMNPLFAAPWPNEPLRHLLAQVLELMWWLQGARLVTIMLDRIVLPEAWHKERLFQDVLGALVYLAAAVAAVAFVLQLPVRGLLATSGAVAIVIGLAIQSTLNDVFSGIVLNATQPFRLGDWITIGDAEGKVVESNWRATSLLNGQGNIVVIPNSVAARTNIVNSNQPFDTNGISVVLSVDPSVRPAVVLDALGDAAASCIDVIGRPAPVVSVRRATEDAIEYEILCYVDSLDKKVSVRSDLFDLAHRHLGSRAVVLRPLSAPRQTTQAIDEKLVLLRDVTIFHTLDADELNELSKRLTRHVFEVGETVFAAGSDEGQALHIIARGVASVTVPKASHDLEVRRLAPGDSIGQSGILAGVQSDVTVRATTRVVVYRLDKEALTPILARRPEVTSEMCRLLSEHRASDQMLRAVPAGQASEHSSLFGWIRESVKRFHQLTF